MYEESDPVYYNCLLSIMDLKKLLVDLENGSFDAVSVHQCADTFRESEL